MSGNLAIYRITARTRKVAGLIIAVSHEQALKVFCRLHGLMPTDAIITAAVSLILFAGGAR